MAVDSRYPEFVSLSVDGKVVDANNPLPVTGGGGSSVKILDDTGNPITSTNRFPVTVTPNTPAAAVYLPVRLTDGMSFYNATGGGGGGGGTAMVDEAAFGEGISSLTPVGGEFNESGGALAAGAAAAVRVTSFRAFHSNLRRADGTEIGTVANPIQVGGTIAAAQSGAWTVAASQSGGWSVSQSGTWNVGLSAGANTVGKVDQGLGGASAWKVDGSAVTQPARTEVQVDYDTGAGTQNLSLIGLALPAAGGAIAGGSATNPIRVDPTGTTAQPITDNGGSLTVDGTVGVSGTVTVSGTVAVSGTVTVSGTVAATQSGTWNVGLNAGSNTIGKVDQGAAGASAWKVDGSAVTQPVSGSVSISGTVTVSGTVAASQSGAWAVASTQSGAWSVGLNTGSNTVGKVDQGVGGASAWKVDGSAVVQPVSGSTTPVPTRGPFTDHSGSIAVGGTAQSLASANPTRVHLFIQNNGVDDLWFNFGSTAVTAEPSIQIPVGASYTSEPEFVSDQAVSIISATTGVTFTCKEA